MHKDKVAVVTGATRGIGKAIALELAKNGAHIAFNYRSERGVKELEEELTSYGVKTYAFQCDVTNHEQVVEMMNSITQEFGRIDILVNNAGITRDNLIVKMSESDFDDVIDTNLKGAFHTTKAVYRQMLKQKNGRIINISSVVGLNGNLGQANYSASKAGLIGFTKSTAVELANKNITVNAVCPGFIQTEMTDQLSDDVKKAILNQIPMRRFAQASEVAKLVNFLASDDASYITGTVVTIDGGMTR